MSGGGQEPALTEQQRMDAFRALVEAQDAGVPVARSRADVAALYGLTEAQVRALEREGLDAGWPPL